MEIKEAKFISVHSKKGGVGKTTVALNIANLLLKKENIVLLFDLDITGTTLTNSWKSVYWEDKVNFVKSGESNNVVSLYFHKYLNNTSNKFDVPLYDFEKTISEDKINIITSQLNDVSNGNGNLLFEPNEFFDILHSTWFLEYIEEICNAIQTKNPKKQLYVVFDNSPGYVALSPYIIKWLTDLGPLRGYFATVSSIDIQDIESCLELIKRINDQYASKYSTAEYYNLLEHSTDEEMIAEPTNLDTSFLMRMMSMEPSRKDSSGMEPSRFDIPDLKYYLDLPQQVENFYSYQGLVINRIPEDLFIGISTRIVNKLDNNFIRYINQLTEQSNISKEDIFNNAIHQDDYIDLQFKEYLLEYEESFQSNRKIINNIKKSLDKILSNSNDFSDLLSHKEINEERDKFGAIIPIIIGYQNIFNNTSNVLSASNVVRSRRFLIKKWYPMSTFEDSVNIFSSLLASFSIDIDVDPALINRKINALHVYANISIINEVYKGLIRNKTFSKNDKGINPIVETILSVLRIQFLYINSRLQNNEFFVSLFEKIIKYQIFEYKRYINSNDKFSFPAFLISQYRDYESHIIIKGNDESETELTSNYYKSILLCQLKLLSFDNDMKIIYEGLQCLYITDKKSSIHASIREIINDFIVLRETTFIDAKEAIKKYSQFGSSMKEFERVLGKLLKTWGI
jgi:hypothetical protein